MIAQSLDTIYIAWSALISYTPQIYIDTTGCAFTFLLAKILGGCKVVAYVHYPTISTVRLKIELSLSEYYVWLYQYGCTYHCLSYCKDMLNLVWERRPSYNHSANISKSSLYTYLKLIYYTVFAVLYGIVGSLSDVIMVNSTWTYGHISFLWRFTFERMIGRQRIHIVYPPCDVQSLQKLALQEKRENIVLSIGQFRPEKDHALQIKSFARLLQKHPELGRGEGRKNLKLILVGSCRNINDEQLVKGLKSLASSLQVSDSIDFVLNQPFPVLKDLFQRASVGIRE